jgi:hypothetical protein
MSCVGAGLRYPVIYAVVTCACVASALLGMSTIWCCDMYMHVVFKCPALMQYWNPCGKNTCTLIYSAQLVVLFCSPANWSNRKTDPSHDRKSLHVFVGCDSQVDNTFSRSSSIRSTASRCYPPRLLKDQARTATSRSCAASLGSSARDHLEQLARHQGVTPHDI